MKNIEIKGKRNIDSWKQKENNKKPLRSDVNTYKYMQNYLSNMKEQIKILNETWLNNDENKYLDEKKELEKILEKKRKGYYYQTYQKILN